MTKQSRTGAASQAGVVHLIQGRFGGPVLLAGTVLGAAFALGACGSGTAAPAQQAHRTGGHAVVVSTSPSYGLESIGNPKVVSQCGGPGTGALYLVATRSHPIHALNANAKGWLPERVVTSGFQTVGGGDCTTTLTWTLPRTEHRWSGGVYLGAADATGSEVAFKVDGHVVRWAAVEPAGMVVSVDLSGAHTFSIVVPGNPAAKEIGPENVVIGNDHLS